MLTYFDNSAFSKFLNWVVMDSTYNVRVCCTVCMCIQVQSIGLLKINYVTHSSGGKSNSIVGELQTA